MAAKFGWKNIFLILFFLWILIPKVKIIINREIIFNNGLETSAIITSVTQGNRWVMPLAYVDYVADGTAYHNSVHIKSNRVSPGDSIILLYSSDNPEKVTAKDRELADDSTAQFIIWAAVPFLALLCCVWSGVTNIIKVNTDLKSYESQ